MKIAIVGTRGTLTPQQHKAFVSVMVRTTSTDVIVTGCCPTGVDAFVRESASKRVALVVFHAAWDLHGKAAGPIRNEAIADYADECIAFPSENSLGTIQCIGAFRKRGKRVEIHQPEGGVTEIGAVAT